MLSLKKFKTTVEVLELDRKVTPVSKTIMLVSQPMCLDQTTNCVVAGVLELNHL